MDSLTFIKSVDYLVYDSSSSVYGLNKIAPYSTEDKVDNPVSLYVAKENKMSFLHMLIQSFIRFLQHVYVSLLSTTYGPS
ncbi:MAG: hypothetical protein K5829_13320 [Treponema sp.]|nr:hypothetical protein [Treponema sp.]